MARSRVTILPSLAGYRRQWLPRDLLAGLTVWAVLVPEALAYATIAGVSPVVGLYAAPPALILYGVLGTSRHLVTGPMAATAALSAAIVADLSTGGPENFAAFTAELALATGVLALLAGLFRLGFLASFISAPVLKGFIIGLALTIMIGQLPKIFGFAKGEGDFFEQLAAFVRQLPETNLATLAVGVGSLTIVVLLKRFVPGAPAALVAVAFGIVAVDVLDLVQHGVATVGPVASGLPSIGLPHDVSLDDFFATAASAGGVVLVAFAEGFGAAKAYAARDHAGLDPNRELIALGAANLGSGLCQGMVVNGSLSKTAVNVSAGARTQLSGIAAAVMTIVTLLFLTGLFEDLPEATLGAIVIGALVELIDISALVALYRLSTRRLAQRYGAAARPDFFAALTAMLGVLVFDTLPGLVIGIAVSLVLLVYRSSRPHIATLGKVPGTADQYGDVDRHPENSTDAAIVVLRVEGGLYFANVDNVQQALRKHASSPGVRAIVLDAESIPFVDISAVNMLSDLAQDLASSGVRLLVAHDIGQVRDVLDIAGAPALADDVFPTVEAAVQAASTHS